MNILTETPEQTFDTPEEYIKDCFPDIGEGGTFELAEINLIGFNTYQMVGGEIVLIKAITERMADAND